MLDNATILLVRHAEKDNPAQDDSEGRDPFLNEIGWKRAKRYVEYFDAYAAEKTDGTDPKRITLTHLFASKDSADSYRPHQTLQPLANTNPKLPFNVSYDATAYLDLVTKELAHPKYENAEILICWHHSVIIKLATALLSAGSKRPPKLSAASDWPTKWPKLVFGWVMQIRYDVDGAAQTDWVRCINPRLMPDDTEDPPGPS